eukprot:6669213-Lingulodinium_polyedra.AAC.1
MPPGARLSETQFLKRSRAAVAAGAPAGAADILSHYEPDRTEASVHEEAFQAQKRLKRQIEAARSPITGSLILGGVEAARSPVT